MLVHIKGKQHCETEYSASGDDITFGSHDWKVRFTQTGLASFDPLWSLQGDLVEPRNQRRGGWSSVIRYQIEFPNHKTYTFYIKRQENQLRRDSISCYKRKPTFWFEKENLLLLGKNLHLTPEFVLYAEQKSNFNSKAILITLALESYKDLNQTFDDCSLAERVNILKMISQSLITMHECTFEHRALYPKHILISDTFTDCRLIDFERGRFGRTSYKAAKNDLERLFRRSPILEPIDRQIILLEYKKHPDFHKFMDWSKV